MSQRPGPREVALPAGTAVIADLHLDQPRLPVAPETHLDLLAGRRRGDRARQVPGVVGLAESVRRESFREGRLDFPQYTRPRVVEGLAVPEVLLSGDHAAIERWRAERALERTAQRRPDLLADGASSDRTSDP